MGSTTLAQVGIVYQQRQNGLMRELLGTIPLPQVLLTPFNCPWRATEVTTLVGFLASVPAATIGIVRLMAPCLGPAYSLVPVQAHPPTVERRGTLFAVLEIKIAKGNTRRGGLRDITKGNTVEIR